MPLDDRLTIIVPTGGVNHENAPWVSGRPLGVRERQTITLAIQKKEGTTDDCQSSIYQGGTEHSRVSSESPRMPNTQILEGMQRAIHVLIHFVTTPTAVAVMIWSERTAGA